MDRFGSTGNERDRSWLPCGFGEVRNSLWAAIVLPFFNLRFTESIESQGYAIFNKWR